MKEIFNINKKASEETGPMVVAQIEEINSLIQYILSKKEIMSSNAAPWVLEHISTALDDIREIELFIKSIENKNE